MGRCRSRSKVGREGIEERGVYSCETNNKKCSLEYEKEEKVFPREGRGPSKFVGVNGWGKAKLLAATMVTVGVFPISHCHWLLATRDYKCGRKRWRYYWKGAASQDTAMRGGYRPQAQSVQRKKRGPSW